MTNALLVYPEYPRSFFGGQFVLDMFDIKATYPPLGLLTVAAMFPRTYNLRLVDLNVRSLRESDLRWADLVFTSTMTVQRGSLRKVIRRCNTVGVPVVAGVPHPTTFYDNIAGVSHFVLGEVEEIFEEFISDWEQGKAKAIYRAPRRPDLRTTPVPRFDLVDMWDYSAMSVQFSRGCPFDCEFCDITKLYGRVSRTKSPDAMLEEFESLYRLGWRGSVFVVDDNFIGNKREATNLLSKLGEWQMARGYPFKLHTEATINLARMGNLMDGMVDAGFNMVFVGIETPTAEALIKMKKPQNVRKNEENYLLNSVRKIQQKGIQVVGGFMVGQDGDDESGFDSLVEFVQGAGIPMATVAMLTAIRGTDLYKRLEKEGRLLEWNENDPVSAVFNLASVNVGLNFVPEMDAETLVNGYKRVVRTLYDPLLENYFSRCMTMFKHLKPIPHLVDRVGDGFVKGTMRTVEKNLSEDQIAVYRDFMDAVRREHPHLMMEAVRLALLGYHFRKMTMQMLAIDEFRQFLAAEMDQFESDAAEFGSDEKEMHEMRAGLLERVEARYSTVPVTAYPFLVGA